MCRQKVFGLLMLSVILLVNGGIAELQRIANGETPRKGQIPYMAHLSSSTPEDEIICGGTIISHRWILTAGHCIPSTSWYVEITLGVIDVTDPHEMGRQNFYVSLERVHVHNDYVHTKHGDILYLSMNDLALIELPEPIVFNKYIQPLALPENTHNRSCYVNETAITAGWGDKPIINGYAPSNKLLHIEVTVISNEECTHMAGIRNTGLVKDEHICTVGNRGRENCNGDSGGPLVLNNNSSRLIGIASFVPGNCGTPGVYTRVELFLDWIEDVMEGLNV